MFRLSAKVCAVIQEEQRFGWEPSALHHALEQLQLGEPGFFLLRLVQAGVASGAPRVHIRLEQARIRAHFIPDPERLPAAWLELFSDRAERLGRSERAPEAIDHLVVACLAALADNPATLSVLYRSPGGDTRLRLQSRSGQLAHAAASLSTYRLEFQLERARGPFLQDLLQGLRRRAAITRLLGERCSAAPIPILLDGRPVNLSSQPGIRPARLNERERTGGFRSLAQRLVLSAQEGPGLLAVGLPDSAAASVMELGPHYLETATVTTPLEGNQTLLYQLAWPKEDSPWPAALVPELRVGERVLVRGSLAYVGALSQHDLQATVLREFVRVDDTGTAERQICYLESHLPGHPELEKPSLAAHAVLNLGWELEGMGKLYALADGVLLAPFTLNLACPGAVALVGEAGLSYDSISLELVETERLADLGEWLRGQTRELLVHIDELLGDAACLGRLRVSQGWARMLGSRLPQLAQSPASEPTRRSSEQADAAAGAEATSSPEMAEHLEMLLTQGRVESSGVFTLSVKQAHLKMGKFQHVNPAFYLLKAVQGAVAAGSREVRIKLGRRDVRVEFSPEVGAELLRGLPDRLIGLQMGQKDALDHLVMACSAAQAQTPACLGWLYSSPLEGFSVKIEAESFETRVTPPQPGPPRVVFYMRRKGGLLDQLAQLASEHNSLGERFALCPVPVYLDGRLINGERWPGKEHLVLHRFEQPPERMNRIVRLVLASQADPGTLAPPCLQQLSARHYDLGRGRRLESVHCLQEVSPTLVTQLRWPDPDGPWPAGASHPLTLTSTPAVRGWRSMVYYVAHYHNFPVLSSGAMLRDYFEFGLIKRQQLLVLEAPSSLVPRGGPPCHAMLALSDTPHPARLWFVQNGMLLDGVQVDLGCPGLLAWVGEIGLATDLSQVRLIENEGYHAALDWLRREAATMRAEAVDAGF